jgi:hypothetical protein
MAVSKSPMASLLILPTFPVVAEAHLGLAKTNCVFALADAIELLKLCLIDALDDCVRSGLTGSHAMALVRRTWLGKYSSMALIPMFCGRSDMLM